ncbi:hypothetical protein M426DRAFT_159016 [Hypoxylon sp. CI-4A]|nr:hypothetical protein M426DRAFT_159016 [Hypoxylon sp. CI-4A]
MMKATKYHAILALWAMSVSADEAEFSVDICPWFYYNVDANGITEIVATCATDGNSGEYQTSALNLDWCIGNGNGILGPADRGVYSESCGFCGVGILEGIVGLTCECDYDYYLTTTSKASLTPLKDSVKVNNGILECNGVTAEVRPYSDSATPKMIPPPSTSTQTQTTTETVSSTVYSTATSTVTLNETNLSTETSTATATATVFVTTSLPAPPNVTVTETKKVTKTHKATKTEEKTATTEATKTAFVTVVVTPTPSHTIGVGLKTTVIASFTTGEAS